MRLKRKEQSARIRVTVWKGLMQSVQSLPADAFTGFPFFHAICYKVFHGAGVHRFCFSQFCEGWFMVKVIAAILRDITYRHPLTPGWGLSSTPIWGDSLVQI